MIVDPQGLLEMIPSKRWFGSKGRTIEDISIVDEAVLDPGPPHLVDALVEVRYEDGAAECFHVPLVIDASGHLQDALEIPSSLEILGRLMAQGATVAAERGRFLFGGPGLDPLAPPGQDTVHAIASEQSNSSVVFDEAVILKLFRRVEPGTNPEVELSRLLTSEGFTNNPAHVGEISYEPDDGQMQIDLGVAQHYVSDGRDGWESTLQSLRDVLASAPEGHAEDATEEVERRASLWLEELAELGSATASLHVLLSKDGFDPDVAPEPADALDLKMWAERAHESLRRLREENERLKSLAEEAARFIDHLTSVEDPGLKMRVHGDYHLGQVLLSERGWMILDFEGEPLRTLEERRGKESPLRDVAGMLRSFGYAAATGVLEQEHEDEKRRRELEVWADAWEELARERFLGAYLRTSHEGSFLPGDRDALHTMLDFFELDKALYEISYEQGHRPDWIRVPLRGIERILAGQM
jgi:trehalose synthase-fused probable maltokinase